MGALVFLVSASVLSMVVRVEAQWKLGGAIRVPAYALWAILNVYLLVGLVWELSAPREESASRLSRTRRAVYIGTALLAAANSLIGVWL